MPDVVAREPESHLREVVGAEREELRLGGDLVGGHGAARHLDHRAHQVLDLDALLLHHLGGHAIDDGLLILSSFTWPTSGIMISGTTFRPSLLSWHAASMMARACISVISGYVMPRRTPRWPSIGLNSCSCSTRASSFCFSSSSAARLAGRFEPRDLDHQVLALRQELVQRRVDGADRHRRAVHRLEDAVEVLALQRQELVERRATIRLVVRQDHPLHDRDAPLAEEHVLGAAQPDAAGAERVRELGLIRQVSVGADAERRTLSAHESSWLNRR